jgi:hypothetical protein
MRRIGCQRFHLAAQLVVEKRRQRRRLDRADGDRIHPHLGRELAPKLLRS